MLDPIKCFDNVGGNYSYDQCAQDYHDFMREMYAYEDKLFEEDFILKKQQVA